jgi:hypothetical protein
MTFELLHKEFETYDRFSFADREQRLSGGLRLLLWIVFLWIEWYLFRMLDAKISASSPYGSFDFLVLFISLSLFLSAVAVAVKGREVFFAKSDRVLLFALPIDEFQLVFSKGVYLFSKLVELNTMLCLPLIILYGNQHGLEAPYYVLSIFYGLFLSVALLAPVCLLSFLLEKAHRLLANREWLQLILASLICIGLCFLYRYVLEAFLTLLVQADVGGLFSPAFLSGLHSFVPYLVPAYSLLALSAGEGDALVNFGWFASSIILSLFVFLALLSHLYVAFIKRENGRKIKPRPEPNHRLLSPFRALLKKELFLLFRDSSSTFSYSALLVMEPFLSAIVLGSLQKVLYYNLQGLLAFFPGIVPAVNLGILLLFAGVISASGAQSFERERTSLSLLKSLPIAPRSILLSKLLVPFTFSSVAFLLSLIVNLSLGYLGVGLFFLYLVLGLLLIATESLAGLRDNIASLLGAAPNGGVLAELLGSLLPLLYAILYLGGSLLSWPSYAIALFLGGLAAIIFGGFLIRGFRPYEEAFVALEVG